MITLLADRSAEPYAREIEQFGRFAGLWETEITYYPPDGSPALHAQGDWEFGFALEGRAVVDVWQVPGRRALAGTKRSPDQECGLCVRVWDPRLQLWRFTFHGTARGALVHMFAREVGDEIVLERADGGELVRWMFSDIRADTFHWRGEISSDGAQSWRLEQELDARRVRGSGAPPREVRSELAEVLHASAPHQALGDQAQVFDRFVGAWDCDYMHFGLDGAVTERYSGSVTFGWIIDGRAMQDVWIGEPIDGEASQRSIGTSIRYFDATSGEWSVFWFAPEGDVVTTVKGGAVGERIVLEGDNPDGSLRRWSFDDIRVDSFVWRGERSSGHGKTWQRTAEYRMSRRDPA